MRNFWPWVPILTGVHTFLAVRRLLAYLRYFQQEGYEAGRFLRWTNVRSLTDPAFWLSIGCAYLFLVAPFAAVLLFIAGAVALGTVQPDPRRSGKIPLRLTWRARRVLTVSVILASVAWVFLVRAFVGVEIRAPLIASSVLFAVLPLVLVVANLVLAPYERQVQLGYRDEAVGHCAASLQPPYRRGRRR